MKKMIATNKQRIYHYEGKKILPNETFNVRDEHVILLTALGWVKDMPPVKAMTAENTSALIPTPTRTTVVVESRVGTVGLTHLTGEVTNENTAETEAVESDKSQTETHETVLNEIFMEEEAVEGVEQSSIETGAIASNEIQQNPEYSHMLRKRAAALGIKVDGRWSDTRIQREIDEYNAKTYQRMDMRASE